MKGVQKVLAFFSLLLSSLAVGLSAPLPPSEIAPGLAPPLPDTLVKGAELGLFDPIKTLGLFEGAIYRKDGTINDWGQFAEWEHENRIRQRPGFNCSGHVLSASRLLLNQAIPLDAARYDRLGDSGRGAAAGQDWDFGWDLVLNIATASTPLEDIQYFDNTGKSSNLEERLQGANGHTLRGFSVWNKAAWGHFLASVRNDRLYLATFSRVGYTKRGLKMLHHHTLLILGDKRGVWAQGASPKNPSGPRVESLLISDPLELKALLSQFSHYKSEQILILSIPLALNRIDLGQNN